jgi:hypothetical protein
LPDIEDRQDDDADDDDNDEDDDENAHDDGDVDGDKRDSIQVEGLSQGVATRIIPSDDVAPTTLISNNRVDRGLDNPEDGDDFFDDVAKGELADSLNAGVGGDTMQSNDRGGKR